MQAFSLAIISLCLASDAWAQKPHPCTSPPLLVGSFSAAGPGGKFWSYGKYNYDALGQRVRFFEYGKTKNETFFMDLLMLFQEGVLYEISWETQSCEKMALEESFHPMEVPHNSTFLGQTVIGSSSGHGQGLLVNTWAGEVEEAHAKYMTTVTEHGCLPVSSLYHTEETGWMVISYFDNLIGIEDPQVFFPPPFCQTAKIEGTTNFLKVVF
ncbi:hypothetical protein AGOR_G00073000 [Albula goreensis]|uniref:Ependymin n=1 Tax=Albula goreensis TaxID=1534307 RepID=A0A8T3DN84_9TELE|nr:hypothetical protein AGOR_G00073000 [Albula goreensis]